VPRILLVPEGVLPKEPQASLLGRKAVEVRGARGGKEALPFAREWLPQLIVFSSQLPDMPAGEFCSAIHSYPELGQTKLLMLTDQLGEEMGEDAMGRVDAHLINPVETAQLLQTMAGLLNMRLRLSKRIQVDLIGQIDLLEKESDEDVKSVVNIINLSETGMLLESPILLTVGSMGRVRFFLPGASKRLSLYCLVRVLADELALHYGVEFTGLKSAEREMLRAVVRTVARAKPE
jgi:CheY-like chemotaxis protein